MKSLWIFGCAAASALAMSADAEGTDFVAVAPQTVVVTAAPTAIVSPLVLSPQVVATPVVTTQAVQAAAVQPLIVRQRVHVVRPALFGVRRLLCR